MTREQRWIASPYGVELLDTPGLLWHKFDDPAVGIKLACTGAIRDEILDLYSLSHELLGMLAQSYPALLEARYGIQIASGDSIGDIFEVIARRRGFLRAAARSTRSVPPPSCWTNSAAAVSAASRSTDAKREMRLCR